MILIKLQGQMYICSKKKSAGRYNIGMQAYLANACNYITTYNNNNNYYYSSILIKIYIHQLHAG